mmetsp:Transcript_24310/g.91793  ORF Transcript_24310/g.91793 Transcript_24310/m.91793 type:complete len:205 (-) Transcript_24310:2871-3485(-)
MTRASWKKEPRPLPLMVAGPPRSFAADRSVHASADPGRRPVWKDLPLPAVLARLDAAFRPNASTLARADPVAVLASAMRALKSTSSSSSSASWLEGCSTPAAAAGSAARTRPSFSPPPISGSVSAARSLLVARRWWMRCSATDVARSASCSSRSAEDPATWPALSARMRARDALVAASAAASSFSRFDVSALPPAWMARMRASV